MATIERNDHLTELIVEAVDAEQRDRCAECGDTAPGNKLLMFYTVRGPRRRLHDGLFCSKDCHDRYHGLKQRGSQS